MTHITRRELLERLIEYKGEEASLPITYANLFTVGELYEMVIENEAKKELAETVKTCNTDPDHVLNAEMEPWQVEAEAQAADAKDWQDQITELRGG